MEGAETVLSRSYDCCRNMEFYILISRQTEYFV
jgi:hypothetical protein